MLSERALIYRDIFRNKKIPDGGYSLMYDPSDHENDDSFCLKQEGDVWVIYYFQQGRREDFAWAKSEDRAFAVLEGLLQSSYGAWTPR